MPQPFGIRVIKDMSRHEMWSVESREEKYSLPSLPSPSLLNKGSTELIKLRLSCDYTQIGATKRESEREANP